MSYRARGGAAFLVLITSLGPTARAQPLEPPASMDATSESDTAAYRKAVGLSLEEYEQRRFEEAREHMQRAHTLAPSARTLRGLGKIEFELRNYGEAVKYLKQALASTDSPLTPALRDETEALLRRASVYVGQLHVVVDPGTATITIDDVTIASGPRASVALEVGDHVLEFRASGRLPERRPIQIRGGQETSVQVVLKPLSMVTPAVTEQRLGRRDGETTRDHAPRRRAWLWTGIGVVAAAAAVGLAVGLARDRIEVRSTGPTRTDATIDGVVLQGLEVR